MATDILARQFVKMESCARHEISFLGNRRLSLVKFDEIERMLERMDRGGLSLRLT